MLCARAQECLRPRGFLVESYRDENCREFAEHIRKDVRHTADGPVVEIGYREITGAARLRDCALLVVTLGLTEVWFDRQTGLYLNFAPDRLAIKTDPSRFSCLATSFQENRDGLEQISLLARRVAPQIKVLVTVSPVALTATFRPIDVVVANAASKSTLRAVADDFVASHVDADYFPSFELVQHSNQDVVRKADRSHVTMATSRAIIDLFARHYVESDGT